MTTRGRPGRGEWLLSAAGTAVALLGFLALEGAARLLPRAVGSELAELHRYSEVYGWEPSPGARLDREGHSMTINSQGYRGRPVASRPAADVPRLVLLGDSIAFGMGVSDHETFGSLLDGDGEGRDFDVVNLAVQGYGPDQSLLKLEREGLSFQPDVVVMNLCLDNDFADAALARQLYDGLHPKPFFRFESEGLVLVDSHLRLTRSERAALFLREHSRLVEAVTFSALARSRPPEHWLDRKEQATADREAAVVLVAALLKRMRDVAVGSGAGFLVLLHPDELGFRPHSAWINALTRCPDLDDVTLVDLRELYRARRLRFDDVAMDPVGHLNPRGHREVAAILRELLRDTGGKAVQ